MKAIAHIQSVPLASVVGDLARFSIGMLSAPRKLALILAILATSTSLCIAAYAGWQRGGLLVERAMMITLGGVAVLFVHLLPMGWRMLRVPAQMCAFAMWCVAIVVVLYGQVSFFMVSHLHAGNQRASMVPETVVPSGTVLPQGRTLTEIAREAAQVSANLASANARRCMGDCPILKAHRTSLAAQLTALTIEADEAKRRQAEEDRRNEQADRNETLRATLRADPVVTSVASWLGATERGLELMLAVACAVVLEGAAIVGWLLVSVAPSRATVVSECAPAKSDPADSRDPGVSNRDAAAPEGAVDLPGRPVSSGESVDRPATPEDDLRLNKIHEAVLSGQIKPTQQAIRTLLRCGQRQAGHLSRQFRVRFGSLCHQGGGVWAQNVAKTAVADP